MSPSISERLRAAFGSSLRETVVDRPTQPDEPNEPPAPGSVEASALPGRSFETSAGPCLLHEARLPLDHRHGLEPLGGWLELPPRALACLARDPTLTTVDPHQVVFLDTETTGLAGGTGTVAFLVGLAHLEPSSDALVIRQLFMRDFGEEPALLLALTELLAPFRHVVTFNGKSFDLPLLETRFVLARLHQRWRPERHFDLLHPARRLWRERLGSCSLGTLEAALLGHWRQADVPSWAIPSLYAAYLRLGQTEPLHGVFDHNRQDLLSLAALLGLLGRRLAEPLGEPLEADELLAVGRLYDELGLRQEACACLEAALARAEGPLRQRVAVRLALAARRTGRYQRALDLWRELSVGRAAVGALIERAKHDEHRRGDLGAALALVEQALALLELREARDGSDAWRRERADLDRRLARLLRKRALAVGR